METANEQLRSRAIRNAVLIERYKAGETKRFLRLYRELEADLVAQVAKRDPTAVAGRYRNARLAILLEETAELIADFDKTVRLETRAALRKLATAEVAAARADMAAATAGLVDFNAPAAATVIAAVNSRPFQGRFLRDWWRDLDAATKVKVKSALQMGVVQGETVGVISRRVREATRQSARSATMVVRTALTHVSATARGMTYAANADLIKGVQWVSTLDERTSDICISLDGKLFPIDSGPRPPAHPNCRSTVVPVLKGWRELGVSADEPAETRASMNGQVPATMSYGDWLKTQPREVQVEVLGRTRADAFRDGRLDVRQLVDQNGRSKTLAELGLD